MRLWVSTRGEARDEARGDAPTRTAGVVRARRAADGTAPAPPELTGTAPLPRTDGAQPTP